MKKTSQFFFLHVTILVLALSFVMSKAAALYMSQNGMFSLPCILSLMAYVVLTVIYAAAWQYNLENYELSFLYTNRCFYMIWSQIFAVAIFQETLYHNNIIGLILIFIGVWVNSKDV